MQLAVIFFQLAAGEIGHHRTMNTTTEAHERYTTVGEISARK
jgi:hypothetical protein